MDPQASDDVSTTLKNYCQLSDIDWIEICIVRPLAELYRYKMPGKYSTDHFRSFIVHYLKNELDPLRTVEDIHDRYEGGIEVFPILSRT